MITNFTQEEAQRMYKLLCQIRLELTEKRAANVNDLSILEWVWHYGIEQTLGKIELIRGNDRSDLEAYIKRFIELYHNTDLSEFTEEQLHRIIEIHGAGQEP